MYARYSITLQYFRLAMQYYLGQLALYVRDVSKLACRLFPPLPHIHESGVKVYL